MPGCINPAHLCGGTYPLDGRAARETLAGEIAPTLGGEVLEAAYGAFQLANARMMRAIHAVSSERGRDPRKFALHAFGGAGPVHAAGIASGLGMRRVVVPPAPGVFSAFGLLTGDIERHFTCSFPRPWEVAALEPLNPLAAALAAEALDTMALWAGSRAAAAPTLIRVLDLQYTGQGSSLSIPLPDRDLDASDVADLANRFDALHERAFGHHLPGQPIRATALRLTARIEASADAGATRFTPPAGAVETGTRPAYWGPEHGLVETPMLGLAAISRGLTGPVLIDGYDTTIVVPPGAAVSPGPDVGVVVELGSDV